MLSTQTMRGPVRVKMVSGEGLRIPKPWWGRVTEKGKQLGRNCQPFFGHSAGGKKGSGGRMVDEIGQKKKSRKNRSTQSRGKGENATV